MSEIASFYYSAAGRTATPEASEESGATLEPGTVVYLTTGSKNAAIYYSTDGTDPTRDNLENLTLYTDEGIHHRRTVTIKAVAYDETMQLSKVGTFQYIVDTIPAVEQKKAEEERLAEESLHDTDASALARATDETESTGSRKVLQEKNCQTLVSGTRDSIPDQYGAGDGETGIRAGGVEECTAGIRRRLCDPGVLRYEADAGRTGSTAGGRSGDWHSHPDGIPERGCDDCVHQ